jgi:hypothetical protein
MVRPLLQNCENTNHKKTIFFYVTIILLLLLNTTTHAQPGSGTDPLPCGDDDPCPLDTWVFVFMGFTLLSSVIYMSRNSRKQVKKEVSQPLCLKEFQ